jgi:hypothetical protein
LDLIIGFSFFPHAELIYLVLVLSMNILVLNKYLLILYETVKSPSLKSVKYSKMILCCLAPQPDHLQVAESDMELS